MKQSFFSRSNQNRVSESGPRSSYRRQPRDKSPDESRGRPRDRPRVKSGESSQEERDRSVESGEREDPKHPTKRERRRRKKMDDHSPVVCLIWYPLFHFTCPYINLIIIKTIQLLPAVRKCDL